MNVLVLNCGSSSVKFKLFDMTDERERAGGVAEQIGESAGCLSVRLIRNDGSEDKQKRDHKITDHADAISMIEQVLRESGMLTDATDVNAIGHRVVHGGEKFQDSTRINEQVVQTIRELSHLAPLHNPANLVGIEATLRRYPDAPQVAVFDTAFHQTMPAHAYRYAIADALYREQGIRRYGFHGTSHRFVTHEAAAFLGKPLNQTNLIVLHLGNGASTAAICGGQSIDTSMGLTPLEGLVMGTRCGDLDPAIIIHLQSLGYSQNQVDNLLNRESGLKGICGNNDMRDVLQARDEGSATAKLALEIYCYRIRKYIGAYAAVLGCVDAVVFTAGIGENAPPIREQVCSRLTSLGMDIDSARNTAKTSGIRVISSDKAPVPVLVVPTNEELEIARQTVRVID